MVILLLLIKYGILVFGGLNILKFAIYFILSPLYELKQKKILSHSEGYSKKRLLKDYKISVLVPAWNEEVGILNTIQSLVNSEYSNMEIIVVNDGSKDRTEELVVEYIKKNKKKLKKIGVNVRYIYKENGGKGSALNVGWKASTGDLVVTMDADTVFQKEALFNAVRYFYDKDIDAIAGNVKVANNRTVVGILQQVEYNFGFYLKRTHGLMMSEYIVGGAFGVFRAGLWRKFGGFDERCKTEDIMFSTLLQWNGCKVSYAEDAIAYTEGASDWKGLYKQRLRWKKGQMDTFLKYKDLFFNKGRKFNKFLTFFMMPIAMFGNIYLLFEPILTITAVYLIARNGDLSMISAAVILIFLVVSSSYLFGRTSENKKLLFLAPIFYFLYYPFVMIEIAAMYNAVKLLILKEDVVWQRWQRKGIGNI